MRSFFHWRRPKPATPPRVRLRVECLEDRWQPAALAAPDLLSYMDSGVSAFDNITRENRPTFAGTAMVPAGVDVWLVVDGSAIASHTVSFGGGESFLLQPPSPLADGVHTARFLDSRTGVLSSPLTFTVDRTPPAAPTAPTLVSIVGDQATFQTRGDVGDRLHLQVAGQTVLSAAATGATQTFVVDLGDWNIDPASPFAFAVVAEDLAGNFGALAQAASTSFLSVGPPPPSNLRLDPTSDTGVFDDDGVTDQTSLLFSGTASPGQSVTLYVDGVAQSTQTVGASGTFSLSAGPFSEGPHDAYVTASAAGVPGPASASIAVVVDRTPPVVDGVSVAPSSLSPNGDGSQDAAVFRFHLSETAYVVVHFLDADGVNLGSIPIDRLDAGDQEFDLAIPDFDEGRYTIVVVASDLADNLGAPASVDFTVDLTPPTTPTLTPAAGFLHAAPVFVGVADPGVAVELREGTSVLGTTTAATNGSWSIAPTLADGTHTLVAVARDAAGNTASSLPLTTTIDADMPVNQTPTLTLPAAASVHRNGRIAFGPALAAGDPDSSRLLVLLTVDEGTIDVPISSGLNFATGNGTPYVTLEGPIAAVGAALAAMVFVPTPGYVGTMNVAVVADDLGLNGSGGAKQAGGSFAIAVVNRPPVVAASPTYTMYANTALDVAGPGLLAAFSDPDGDAFSLTVAVQPSVGTLTVNADGSFRYVPPTGYVGRVSFAVKASDGVADSPLVWAAIDVTADYGLRRRR